MSSPVVYVLMANDDPVRAFATVGQAYDALRLARDQEKVQQSAATGPRAKIHWHVAPVPFNNRSN